MDTYQQKLSETIDACRPGSTDLLLPEMRELSDRIERDAATRQIYERCQQLDAVIAEAVREVDVPEDLCARLLARVKETNTAGPKDHNDSESAKIATSKPNPFRSKWFAVGGTIAACLVVAVVGASILIPGPPVSLDELELDVRNWVDQVQQNPWNMEMDSAPDYAVGRFVVAKASGWQELRTAYDSRAVAFDLRDNNGSHLASLIVVKSVRSFAVGQSMPSSPSSTTGGYSVGACKKGDFLFVLVVEGSQRRYQQFARPVPPVM